ncbi:MAG: hypothetical protein MZV70_16915 [Desulfobacterales bacterium]|nr:hypothetical protein [Desulfobacterales bacterium]
MLQNPATETVDTAGDDRAHIAVSDLQDAGKSANEHIQVFASHPQTAPSGKGETQVSGESGAVRQTVTFTELTGIHRPILKALAAGERQLIIEIRPPDLGTLQIRLHLGQGHHFG